MMGDPEHTQNTTGGDIAVDTADRSTVDRLAAEVADLKDRLLRALADQENVRNRAERARDEGIRFAVSEIAKDLLATVDNLHRAIDSVPEESSDEAMRNLLIGITATERALLGTLERHGITRIDPVPGEAFDPNRHEAMVEVADSAHPAGTVTQVVQPGYAHHERLLRPALVGVAARDGSEEGQAPSTGENGSAAQSN